MVSIAPGETLFFEGDRSDSLYILTDGCVRLSKMLADGRRQITGFLFPSDFLGLALRERYCAEMRCQIIFYQIHARARWTEMFALHADGQLAGFAKRADLPFFLRRLADCDYVHLPALAPSEDILKDFRKDRDWTSYVRRFEAERTAFANHFHGDLISARIRLFIGSSGRAGSSGTSWWCSRSGRGNFCGE